MNRILRKAVSHFLSLVLIGSALSSPSSAQERSRANQVSANFPGLIGEALRGPASQTELGLTEDQIGQLQKIAAATDYFGKIGPVLAKLRRAETEEERLEVRKEVYSASDALTLEMEAKARQVLDEAQFRRAMQIHLQRLGVRGLIRSDVIRDLGITTTQADQLGTAANDYDNARMQLGFGIGEAEREKLRNEHETRMRSVLTEDQQAKWTAKLGKPFEADPLPVPLPGRPRSGQNASRSDRDTLPQSARGANGPQLPRSEFPLPCSYGMVEDDSITEAIRFVAVDEVLAARGRTLSVNRDQLQLLTNLQTRIQFDHRRGDLRQRVAQARTFDECAAIRAESCVLLEQWNAEVEKELRTILGEEAFAKLRPAILRRQGLWALTRPDVAEELKITPKQADQLKTILNEYRAAAAGASVDATRPERSRLAAEFEERMRQVLTAEQRMQWDAKLGVQRAA